MKETISLRIFHTLPFIYFLSLSISGVALPTNETEARICQTEACKAAAQNFINSIDQNIDPCDNFYLYACGNWSKNHMIRDSSTLSIIKESNKQKLQNFIRKNDTEDEPEIVHKIRKIYLLCLNQDKHVVLDSLNALLRETIGIPVEVDGLNETVENFDYIAALAKFSRKTGRNAFFGFDVTENHYNRLSNTFQVTPSLFPCDFSADKISYESLTGKMPVRRILPKLDEQESKKCENISSLFCEYTTSNYTSVPEFLIEEGRIMSKKCDQFKWPEELAALGTPFLNYSSRYVPRTLQDLQNMTDNVAKKVNSTLPMFNWTRYIEELYSDIQNVTLDLGDPSKVEIITVDWDRLRDMLEIMHMAKSAEHMKYIIWYMIISNYKFSVTNIHYATPESCSRDIISAYGMALTYMYSSTPKYKKAKNDIRIMFKYIKQSLKEIMQRSSWLDEKGKEKSLRKLELLKSNIVYPNFTKSSASGLYNFFGHVNVNRSFFDAELSKEVGEYEKRLSTLNQQNDREKDSGTITPDLVNAFYSFLDNMIYIPAAVVENPIYNGDSLAALNYGAIGSIVGHELSHGFDSKGRQFNEIGSIEDWWQGETLEKYKAKGKCFVKAYDTYNITVKSYDFYESTLKNITLKSDSKLTLAEDISDNEGFRAALFAYRKYVSENGPEPRLPLFENYTHEQLFTLSFANTWCENPKRSSTSKYNTHSPMGVRVNGVMKNSNEFAEIWKCPKGSDMNPNVEKCSIW